MTEAFFKQIKDQYGVSLTWLASKLGMTRQAFQYACKRGLSPEEAKLLQQALHDSGHRLTAIKVPDELMKPKGSDSK